MNPRSRKSPTDIIALVLLLAALVGAGVLYGIWAHYRDWFPAPQIRGAYKAWMDLREDLGPHWSVAIPGRRPAVKVTDRQRLAPGLLMVVGVTDGPRNFIRVMDRDGQIIHEWKPDWFEIWGPDEGGFPADRRPQSQPGAELDGVAIAENGDVVLNFQHLSTMRLSPCGDVVWKLDNLGHHSVHIDADGTIWVGAETYYSQGDTGYQNHDAPLNSWSLQRMSAQGEILETLPMIDVLRKNDLLGLLYLSTLDNAGTRVSGDTLHLNDVETFPPGIGSSVFAPGDVMVSLRNINTVLVMDPRTHAIKFRATGEFLRQHDPDFIGGDRIILFDNRNLHPSTGPEVPRSRILELDAATGTVSVRFQGAGESAFFTNIMGKQQLLGNGNLLVTATWEGRAFEVAPDGTLLWQYNNVVADGYNGLVSQVEVLPSFMDRESFDSLAARCSR